MEDDPRFQLAALFLKMFGVLLVSAALRCWRRNPVSVILFYVSTVLLVMTACGAAYLAAFFFHYTREVPDWVVTMSNAAFYATWILIPLLWVGHLGWILAQANFPAGARSTRPFWMI